VEIEAEGPTEQLDQLLAALGEAPPPVRVDTLETRSRTPLGEAAFRIEASAAGAPQSFSLQPDLATCADCMAEVLDPGDRRFGHAFASCTRCGPRYSVATGLPWDRVRTAMAGFAPCARCRAEHDDPRDRRFHAQTLACHDCGPRLALLAPDGRVRARDGEALQEAIVRLRGGEVVAVLGVGGFQLLVDARDDAVVRRLRKRKHRPHKPLALAVADLAAARALVRLDAGEREALASPAGPIVIARRRSEADVAASVAAGLPWLGVMLPTTPLHRLLLDGVGGPLVATSGNPSGEPLCATDTEALAMLGEVADAFLTHDRPVVRPIDDSVVRAIAGQVVTLRCARGLAPLAFPLAEPLPALAAIGGDWKAAPAVARGTRAVLGPHVGELDAARARDAAGRDVRALCALSGVEHARLVADDHPDSHAGDLARALDPGAQLVRHHLAHVLSCLAEHGAKPPVLAATWDGSGHGGDGTVWGGEILRVDEGGFERLAHLRRFRLPGGDAAAREPRRAALGLLFERFGPPALARDDPPLRSFAPREREALGRLLASGRFAPETSSAGRLFDAVAALLDLRQRCSYEAQAALELEAAAADDPEDGVYPVRLRGRCLDWGPLLDALLAERDAGVPSGVIAARFHRGLACAIVAAVERAARETGTLRVVLTGGCFQNARLTSLTKQGLEQAGLEPLLHRTVPPNDGGLAVGQLLAAARRIAAVED
jgi:hydrogenase maturation protein HypF